MLLKFGKEIEELILERSHSSEKFEVTNLKSDGDHIHMIVNYHPGETIRNIVKQLKSYTAYHIWERYPELKFQFWKKKMFWSDGYFACSIGEASRDTIQKYIESQGDRPQIIRKEVK